MSYYCITDIRENGGIHEYEIVDKNTYANTDEYEGLMKKLTGETLDTDARPREINKRMLNNIIHRSYNNVCNV